MPQNSFSVLNFSFNHIFHWLEQLQFLSFQSRVDDFSKWKYHRTYFCESLFIWNSNLTGHPLFSLAILLEVKNKKALIVTLITESVKGMTGMLRGQFLSGLFRVLIHSAEAGNWQWCPESFGSIVLMES